MENELIVYVKKDIYDSIVDIRSNIFLEDTSGYEPVDEWQEGQDRYLYSHADNGEYIKLIHGNTLFDEQGRPNFHGKFIEWTEEEKQEKYPTQEHEPSELEQLKKKQEITEQALQDLILATLSL